MPSILADQSQILQGWHQVGITRPHPMSAILRARKKSTWGVKVASRESPASPASCSDSAPNEFHRDQESVLAGLVRPLPAELNAVVLAHIP